MKYQYNTSEYQQSQRAYPAKHQPNYTTLTTTDTGTKDNNKKPVLILARTTLAIDQRKATLAITPTGIQSQVTWIRGQKWN